MKTTFTQFLIEEGNKSTYINEICDLIYNLYQLNTTIIREFKNDSNIATKIKDFQMHIKQPFFFGKTFLDIQSKPSGFESNRNQLQLQKYVYDIIEYFTSIQSLCPSKYLHQYEEIMNKLDVLNKEFKFYS